MDVQTRGDREQRVQRVIDRLVRDGSAVSHADGSQHDLFPVAASIAECQALRERVVREKATRTIEIGLAYAMSALHICAGLLRNGDPDAHHIVLDPHQATRFANCGLQFLDAAGVAAMVEHRAEVSEIALPRFLSDGRQFDLAFIDGNHRFDGVFLDLIYLGRLVCRGGIIFLDDYQLPAIVRAVAFGVTNLGWTLEDVSAADEYGQQWAVLRTATVPDTRPFEYYVAF